ncbi:MAG: glycerophosphoryl diester phosphodiesterase, partial [Deltaproteobacteria bacterium]|nr:glycerophosphoryl diester phosphodiesterase [Deltaproteobacteria bacterium]
MDIVGHRGACGHAPENTLKSFAKAIELGCQRVELDVHLSKDKIPVVIHDPTVDRTTNGAGAVRELILEELKRLNAGEGEQIPTLLEVMNVCRGRVDLQIELKGKNTPRPVAAITQEHWDPKRAVITSFDLSLLDQFSSLMPEVPSGLLSGDSALDLVGLAEAHGHVWICPRFNIVTTELVRKAHAANLLVYVYHVNVRQTADKLVEWG